MSSGDEHFEAYVRSRSVRPPKILYKYTTARTARQILTTRKLRFQSPLNYNDPFDSQWDGLWFTHTREYKRKERALLNNALRHPSTWPPEMDSSFQEALKAQISQIEALPTDSEREDARDDLMDQCTAPAKATKEFEGQVRKIRERMRVLCLSGTDRSMLMWSHYAEQHRGVVIGFDSEHCENFYRRPFENIAYRTELPMLLDPDAWARSICLGLPRPEVIDPRALVLTKARCWEYEQEWRFVWTSKDSGTYTDFAFPPTALVEVVFGCRTDQTVMRELTQLARVIQPNASMTSVSTHSGGFELSRNPID